MRKTARDRTAAETCDRRRDGCRSREAPGSPNSQSATERSRNHCERRHASRWRAANRDHPRSGGSQPRCRCESLCLPFGQVRESRRLSVRLPYLDRSQRCGSTQFLHRGKAGTCRLAAYSACLAKPSEGLTRDDDRAGRGRQRVVRRRKHAHAANAATSRIFETRNFKGQLQRPHELPRNVVRLPVRPVRAAGRRSGGRPGARRLARELIDRHQPEHAVC